MPSARPGTTDPAAPRTGRTPQASYNRAGFWRASMINQ